MTNLNKELLLHNINIREIQHDDFDRGYMKLLFQFTNYEYPIDKKQFISYLNEMKNRCEIMVIHFQLDNTLIGAGTIFKIEKLHNNPIGQIEDVIIDEKYRKLGLGKKIINKLVDVGLNKFKCYKIVLNALEKNTDFYISCGFQKVGNEFKYSIKI